MNKSYELIIFDCDGTLIDSEHVNIKSISEILLSIGFDQFDYDNTMRIFTGCSVKTLEAELTKLEVKDPFVILDQMHKRSIELAKSELKAINGAHELVSNLKIPFAMATNGERLMVDSYLEIVGLRKYFPNEIIFSRADVKNPKPAADLYLLAAKKMGVLPEKCLVIEDSVIGVTAAVNAAMDVIGFVGGSHHARVNNKDKLMEAGAKYTVSNLIDVNKFL